MLDILMLALLALMFVVAVGYVRTCERLTQRPGPPDGAAQ